MNQSIMAALCKAHGIPEPKSEVRFDPKRKFRFDFAWADEKVALEVEGGAFTQGRHTRGQGFVSDIFKYHRAVLLGWKLFRCTPAQLESGEIFETLREVFR